ncbi:MAG: hypothetical protein SFY81_16250 [Verrucomicrobiota bacterium]|nr:hypothetical protein [Verrucomicrobiota bacterium]
MMMYHELAGFMPPALANEILEFVYQSDKPVYKGTLAAVAEAKKVRPAFLEKKSRKDRHEDMIGVLSRPRMEEAAASLIRGWLAKTQQSMLADFLNTCGIRHEDGIVEDFPESMDEEKLKSAIDLLLSKYPTSNVIIYLNAVATMTEGKWTNLDEMLKNDPRLQF